MPIKDYVFLLLFLISFSASAAVEGKKTGTLKNQEADEKEIIDFSSIKSVLKNDMLEMHVEKKVEEKQKVNAAKKKSMLAKYEFPNQGDFWHFFTEYWLVKNAQILKWDFEKPDYGLNVSFQKFLEERGYYEKKFKILLLNSPIVAHFALPARHNEYIFLLSVPFIRSMNLSKLEISLLMFEDFLRVKMGYFSSFLNSKAIRDLVGTNFHSSTLDKTIFDKAFKKYDEFIFKKGFNFQQQFEVTIKMSEILKSDLKIWNVYIGLLGKVDNLVKSDSLFGNYTKIYPSPELQVNWISPPKKSNE